MRSIGNKDKPGGCGSTRKLLMSRQGYPLHAKEALTHHRIKEWYEHFNGKVYVAFSGGKDSTALLHMVRSQFPEVPAVFADTGLEYPEIRKFVKETPNSVFVKPKLTFRAVLEKYGFPVASKKISRMIDVINHPTPNNEASRTLYLTGIKRDKTVSKYFKLAEKWRFLIDAPFKISDRCCFVMKKEPLKRYEKESGRAPIIGTMAEDSEQRQASYLQSGCNSFNGARRRSVPMSFWLEKDVWEYIKENKIPYCSVYDNGERRTGCIFCMFGCYIQQNKEERFERLKESHPATYKYCMEKLGLRKVLDFIKNGIRKGK